jgi:hypothetical protein
LVWISQAVNNIYFDIVTLSQCPVCQESTALGIDETSPCSLL